MAMGKKCEKIENCMRVRTFDWETFGPATIIKINKTDGKFVLLSENSLESEEYDFDEMKDKFEIYIDDKEVRHTTYKLQDINLLKKGIIIKTWNWDILAIKDIETEEEDEDEEKSYFIVHSDDMWWSEDQDSIEDFDVITFHYGNEYEDEACLEYTQLYDNLKSKKFLWEQIENWGQIIIWTRVQKLDQIGKIIQAPDENDFQKEFKVQFQDGSIKSFGYIEQDSFQIFLPDHLHNERDGLDQNWLMDYQYVWLDCYRPENWLVRNTRLKEKKMRKRGIFYYGCKK